MTDKDLLLKMERVTPLLFWIVTLLPGGRPIGN
jgi:hypothetical protein